MFVELHILQNFAPSNLNRDDTNAPKDCEFGGYRRARISSQCLKRAIRWNGEFRRVLDGCGFATRTKWQVNAIATAIREMRKLPDDDKASLAVAHFVIRRAGFKEKGNKTTVLLFLGKDEIDAIVSTINDHWKVIVDAADVDQLFEEAVTQVETLFIESDDPRLAARADWIARLVVDFVVPARPTATDFTKVRSLIESFTADLVPAFQKVDDAAFSELDSAHRPPDEDEEEDEQNSERVPKEERKAFAKKRTKKIARFSAVLETLNALNATDSASASTDDNADEQKKALTNAVKNVVKAFRENGTTAVDVAMFARMIAEAKKGQMNVTAACQVAHAISTNKAQMEFDFYTAVDELNNNETGAGMMGVQELTSPCYYRYASIDVAQLCKNLLGKHRNKPEAAPPDLREQAESIKLKVIEAFIRGSVDAIPSGKTAGTAPWNAPSLVMAVVRPHGVWSLANAFVVPVSPHDGFVIGSIKKLDEYWQTLTRMYGSKGIQQFVSTESPAALKCLKPIVVKDECSELDALIEGVLAALQPTKEAP